jgi:hypothetical protein
MEMNLLTLDALLLCKHVLGKVSIAAAQSWVTIEGRPVLIDDDPESKSIKGCPNTGVAIKPCTTTFKVTRGYSDFLRVNGKQICLDTVEGFTDGLPPVTYNVKNPGQRWVGAGA